MKQPIRTESIVSVPTHYKKKYRNSRALLQGERAVDKRSQQEREQNSLPQGMSLATGCTVFDDCLECPLPKCVYDEPLSMQLAKSKLGELFELFEEGWSYDKIARHTGSTYGTVKFIISQRRGDLEKNYTENQFLLEYESK